MRKLIINTFVTLDGVMQAPGGPEEDPTSNFNFGGWSFHYWDEVMGNFMDEFMSKPFELLLGRKTYEIFAAHWPYITNDPVADKFNATKKYVASRTVNKLNWANSILIKSNVENEIKKIKEQNGPELQVHGSSNLIKTLVNENLVDQFNIWTFPVTVGKGKQLFGEGVNASNLKLVDVKSSGTGVIIATYQPAGGLKLGSFALEDETEEELARRRKLASE
ncbi:MAG: dihydrofolate reductase [Ignavibacteriota bacterium]|jgi:dihydrofolate reductase|nr:MAG: dihydrofolate reductase [Chlorobiota bacterium]MBE7475973.1 dihydrofolate reductase family protein [Ignavibacteriales bacterium]MBL1123219.1 dihydrofolate reductase [Ignavibacteriota bacterium]MCC7092806.1 dihydrofolate reductase family protein [Ignavibacteriaceae bacterium]MCE7856828.1 dihydrofolate reductase [Ignavibacteria bacterium CHB3]MEB2295697.1 dihydrofolate reductase family protein [Ignavibacteria bacterium]